MSENESRTVPPLTDVKAELFKAMAHPARVQVLQLLSAAPVLTVAELKLGTSLEASNLSQHLGILRRMQLVTASRRDGQVTYALSSPHVSDLLASARVLLNTMLHTSQQQLEQAGASHH
ncbi:MAG: transcriptional regulator [Micrococcaceae bacterium]|jgi:DNA-binding transcriptional ArsR family regulator|nr:transcriptional regulator [Micrococcaceae bacterium]